MLGRSGMVVWGCIPGSGFLYGNKKRVDEGKLLGSVILVAASLTRVGQSGSVRPPLQRAVRRSCIDSRYIDLVTFVAGEPYGC